MSDMDDVVKTLRRLRIEHDVDIDPDNNGTDIVMVSAQRNVHVPNTLEFQFDADTGKFELLQVLS